MSLPDFVKKAPYSVGDRVKTNFVDLVVLEGKIVEVLEKIHPEFGHEYMILWDDNPVGTCSAYHKFLDYIG